MRKASVLVAAAVAAVGVLVPVTAASATTTAAPNCSVSVDYPHGSHTVPGATNVHGVLKCDQQVTGMTIRVKLWLRTGYQQYQLVGDSGDVSNSGKNQIKSNAAWGECHNGWVMHGEAYGSATQVPWLPVNVHTNGPDVNVVGC
ncbi:hypothetical protein [Actinokineospora diospyrosa]|uniref:Secreted protein n=1 Tax=Actinokineospora diospyrosa TaxID=103728 RepID=A0ABT1IFY1_9PSEU|nr:hypothetical protein [Actinokineospora diospyrosa]MCP2271553.1 hypothetical protein [Actinokineospora diospyrosa]